MSADVHVLNLKALTCADQILASLATMGFGNKQELARLLISQGFLQGRVDALNDMSRVVAEIKSA